MKAWCPNHWATREFPVFVYFTKKKKRKSLQFLLCFNFVGLWEFCQGRRTEGILLNILLASLISIRANGVWGAHLHCGPGT